MEYLIQSAPYETGIIAALMAMMVMAALFDGQEFFDTAKAYYMSHGITAAIAWMVPAIFRAVKKEFTK